MTGVDSDLLQVAATQGIWALLFCILFVWFIRETKERETRMLNREGELRAYLDRLATGYERATERLGQMCSDMEEMRRSIASLATATQVMMSRHSTE